MIFTSTLAPRSNRKTNVFSTMFVTRFFNSGWIKSCLIYIILSDMITLHDCVSLFQQEGIGYIDFIL